MNYLYPGEELPANCVRCAFTGPYWVQKAVFSGDKWIHNQGALAVMGPDGIIYD